MKKIVLFFSLIFLLCSPCASAITVKIDNMSERDATLDEMLPNPVIYLCGTDRNGFPLLLMNFSATIPFYGIRKNPNAFIRKRITWLKFAKLRLKIEPTANPKCCKNFYYKILKIDCQGVSQTIDFVDKNTLTAEIKPTYKGAEAGSIKNMLETYAKYNATRPIISYSGVGSDTLKIMLRRGRRYPIPSGHIDVAMIVLAVPYYTNPINYCTLDEYDYVRDFMDSKESEDAPCTKIRTVSFQKAYSDNYLRTEYVADPKNNPRKLILDSQVILGECYNSRIEDKKFMDIDVLCPIECEKEVKPCPSGT